MTADDLEAAWALSTSPRRPPRRGYDAAIRIVRWRWMLVPIMVLIAGCLPSTTPGLPASLHEEFSAQGQTFSVQTPPAGETGQDIVAALRADSTEPMFLSRAVPIFGVVDCHGIPGCAPVPGGQPGEPARTVWVVIYPDWTGPDRDVGWMIVDAVMGLDGGMVGHDPRSR